MKKQLLLQALFFIFISVSAQNFEWAKAIGGLYDDDGVSIAVDHNGNVYTLGLFMGTVDFDPGPDTYYLDAPDFYSSIFISKLDKNGDFLWAKEIPCDHVSIAGTSIAVDTSGNAYLTGYFSGTVDFDPSPHHFNLTAYSTDMFILNLNASGNFKWARRIGGNDAIGALGITLDNSGNIYLTGDYSGTIDFDPGPGIYNLTSVQMSLDIFIVKLRSSGKFVWVKTIGAESDHDYGKSIAVDVSGNVYTTGCFEGQVDFDPGAATYYLNTLPGHWYNDIFISKIDSSGYFVWARRMGAEVMNAGNSIALDEDANIYTAGSFLGTADFGPFTFTNSGSNALFIVKLDCQGNFKWAKSSGADYVASLTGKSLAVDIAGNVYTTGLYHGTAIDFDPGTGTYYLTSSGDLDIFITELDSAGNFVFAKSIGGAAEDIGNNLCLDALANIYVTGHFSDDVNFCSGAGNCILTSASYADAFILKLDNIYTGTLKPVDQNIYTVFPNPACNQINVKAEAALIGSNYFICNLPGTIILTGKLNTENTAIDLTALNAGMYILMIGDNTKQVFKLIKQ